jgi:transposase InsO family protein
MTKTRRTYTCEFKLEAVRLWQTSGRSASQIECAIESFYNRRRRHSALDYLSPEAYERLWHQ